MNPLATTYNAILHVPFGAVGVRLNCARTQLQELVYLPSHTQELAPDCDLAERVCRQIESYIANPSFHFDLPLQNQGTAFQQKVWLALLEIPFGRTVTYQQISQHIGAPTAVRAVAGAVGRNLISIVVPCHRVIGSNGTLTGYAGGLDRKLALLTLEGVAA